MSGDGRIVALGSAICFRVQNGVRQRIIGNNEAALAKQRHSLSQVVNIAVFVRINEDQVERHAFFGRYP